MNKNFLFIGIGAALLLLLLSKRSAGKNLKIYFQNLGLRKKKGLPDIIASFRIINPTSSQITIDSIVGDLYVNNNPISSVSNVETIKIPGQSETIYSVKIQTSALSALQTIYNLLKDKTGKFNVKFEGTANSGGLLIPINETIYTK